MSSSKECGNKVRHPTREAATVAMGRTRGYPLHVYRCPWCNCWHVGHMRGWEQRQMRQERRMTA